jgi:hypothetical protein
MKVGGDMDYLLNDTQKEIVALTRQIAEKEIIPVRAK